MGRRSSREDGSVQKQDIPCHWDWRFVVEEMEWGYNWTKSSGNRYLSPALPAPQSAIGMAPE